MSLEVLIEEFLSSMKEDGELDVFLPSLLSAMGHDIVSRPQKGVRQSGGDMVSIGVDPEDRKKKVHIWVIKCGDIDRAAWGSGDQAVRQTLEIIVDVFLRSNIPPAWKRLPKKVCIATNGDFKQVVSQEISGYLDRYCTKYELEADQITGSILARWTAEHMLDERIMPSEERSLMRRALANVESPESGTPHARQLIRLLLDAVPRIKGGEKTKERRVKGQLQAVALFNTVLFGWARRANNLESAYQAAEFTLLASWALLHAPELAQKPYVSKIYAGYVAHYLVVAENYHAKLAPYYLTEGAFATALHDNCLVAERVFEEIGRLGVASLCFSILGARPGAEAMSEKANLLADRLFALISTHSVSAVPAYDRHAIDISCGLAALTVAGRRSDAREWLRNLVIRCFQARQSVRYAPLSSDSFDDLVAVRYRFVDVDHDLLNATTLLPTLAFWCNALGNSDSYALLVERAVPAYAGSTLNVWLADKQYESFVASPAELRDSGFAAYLSLPVVMEDLPGALPVPPEEALDFSQLNSRYGFVGIFLFASRHWKLQLPHDHIYRLVRELERTEEVEMK